MNAANMTNSPWAKLIASVALKTSTKPSAISAYISPIISPLVKRAMVNCRSNSGMGRLARCDGRHIEALDRQADLELAGATVLVGDFGDQLDVARLAVERRDGGGVLIRHEAPPDLA